jgi:hypothetical protein
MVPYSYPPSKTHRAEDSDAYSCVKEPLFGKTIIFRMILSLPSIIHQIPTQYAVCDQHSVLLSKSAIVDGNCCIPGKKMLLKEHAAYRLQSALTSSKKQYSCRTIQYVEKCNTTFNEAQPSSCVSCMTSFLRKDFTSSEQLS